MGWLELAEKFVRDARFRVVEPRSGYWTDNPLWGRHFDGVYPQAAGESFSVASSDKFPGVPKLHTVQLFRGDDRSVSNADVYAKVSYGVGGTNNSFLLDWGAGAQFSLIANSVRVDAVSYAPDGTTPYNGTDGVNPAPLLLGVSFGQGNVGHGPPLTKTEPAVTLDWQDPPGPVIADFLVPDFARAFTVRTRNLGVVTPLRRGNTDPTQLSYVSFLCTNAVAATLAFGDCQLFAGAAGALGVPIPGGTQRVQLANESNGAAAPYNQTAIHCTLQWVLSL